MTHVNFVEDSKGGLVDIWYACSFYCARKLDFPQPSNWPGGMETDYDVHCYNCGELMWEGLET